MFFSGAGSPGQSQTKGCKTVVVVVTAKFQIEKIMDHSDSLWPGVCLFSVSSCSSIKDKHGSNVVTITYPVAAVHRRLLLDEDVDILNCIHSEQTFAGAKLHNITVTLYRYVSTER